MTPPLPASTPWTLSAPVRPPNLRRWQEFLRYFAASAVALAVDLAVLNLAVKALAWHYQAGAAAGFGAGTLVAYLISVSWVFEQRNFQRWQAGLSRFALVGLAGLALNAVLMAALAGELHLDITLAKLMAAGVSFFFNFAGRRLWLFSRRPVGGAA